MSRQSIKIALVTLLLISPFAAFAAGSGVAVAQSTADRLKGYILLQVQARGQAWYVRPSDGLRYYMADGSAAYQMMRGFSLGISDADLAKIPSVASTAEMKSSVSACAANPNASAVRGKILLQVQKRGEAWYVDPVKCRAIYMADGAAAYSIMRYLSLGIADADLELIPIGTLPNANIGGTTADATGPSTDTTAADAAATTADTSVSGQGTTQSAADAAAESAAMASYVSPQNWIAAAGGDALTDF